MLKIDPNVEAIVRWRREGTERNETILSSET